MASKEPNSSGDLDVEEFLTHKTSSGGGAYLSGWKDDGKVVVWHSTLAPIARSVWTHRAPHVVEYEDRKTKAKISKVMSSKLVCWEDVTTLRAQYKLDDDGRRVSPPERCGQCKFVDYIRLEVYEGRLDWLEPIFKFQGADDENATIVRAGHVYNGFSKQDLSEEAHAAMKAKKVFPSKAWMLNHYAKASYIFVVAEDAHPEKGLQVATETALLGDKIKVVISDEREKHGADAGNPMKRPYAIRWEFDEKEREFGKKYNAKAMTEGALRIEITPEIRRLITEVEPPDVKHMTTRFNALAWRTEMESQCLIDIPWDKLYGDSAYGEGYVVPGGDFDTTKLGPKKTQIAVPAAKPAEIEMVACDKCQKDMRIDATKCPHCGAEYDVDVAEPVKPQPAPPPRLTRAQAMAAKKVATVVVKTPAPEGDGAEGDDDIPF